MNAATYWIITSGAAEMINAESPPDCLGELQTNLREYFTITAKAPTSAFPWLKATKMCQCEQVLSTRRRPKCEIFAKVRFKLYCLQFHFYNLVSLKLTLPNQLIRVQIHSKNFLHTFRQLNVACTTHDSCQSTVAFVQMSGNLLQFAKLINCRM